MITRTIPSTGESLPVIGLGTWQTFDVDDLADKGQHEAVLKQLVVKGGSVVDSSPMYGSSEKVLGDLTTKLELNDRLFMATKVWTTGKKAGEDQIQSSFQKLRRPVIDLLQIHNLSDWQTQLKTLRALKTEGKIRYIGITHYTESAYSRLEEVIQQESIDFLQVNYSVLRRKAEERLLPLAADKKIAVLINQPFEEGTLFAKVKGKTLPDWATEIDCTSWSQFFLKFILAHPAVTCVIPGTAKPHHMIDNAGAGFGKLPQAHHVKEMIRYFEKI